MKKVFYALSFIVLSFYSCTNDSGLESSEVSKGKISEVINESNLSTQKMKYGMLNKDEKFLLWENKIKVLMEDLEINNEQKNLLIDLKNNLSASIFDDTKNNDRREVFKTVYAKEFLKKANKLFSEEYIITNFYYVNYKTDTGGIEDGGGAPKNCNCTTQNAVTCFSTIQNPLYCKKAESNCSKVPSNCGFLLWYDCDGMCISNWA